jgi:hypothetical protein
VIIDGREVMRHRLVLTMREADVLAAAKTHAARMLADIE